MNHTRINKQGYLKKSPTQYSGFQNIMEDEANQPKTWDQLAKMEDLIPTEASVFLSPVDWLW